MKKNHKNFGSVGNMKAAAAALGLEFDTLRETKAAGCRAFKQNGSVNLDELTLWLNDAALARAWEAMAYAQGDLAALLLTFEHDDTVPERWKGLQDVVHDLAERINAFHDQINPD